MKKKICIIVLETIKIGLAVVLGQLLFEALYFDNTDGLIGAALIPEMEHISNLFAMVLVMVLLLYNLRVFFRDSEIRNIRLNDVLFIVNMVLAVLLIIISVLEFLAVTKIARIAYVPEIHMVIKVLCCISIAWTVIDWGVLAIKPFKKEKMREEENGE